MGSGRRGSASNSIGTAPGLKLMGEMGSLGLSGVQTTTAARGLHEPSLSCTPVWKTHLWFKSAHTTLEGASRRSCVLGTLIELQLTSEIRGWIAVLLIIISINK